MKVAFLVQVCANPLVDFVSHLVRIARQLLCAIFSQFGHGRLCGIPIPTAILVKVRRSTGEATQRISKHGWRLARHDATESYPPILDAFIRRCGRRRGAKIDSASNTSAGCVLA